MALKKLGIPFAIAFFLGTQFQPSQMLAQRFAHQGRTVLPGTAGSLVRGLKEFSIENDLDGFHMWILLHSNFHSQFPRALLVPEAFLTACAGIPDSFPLPNAVCLRTIPGELLISS
jgi:hypothetical protein